jgi:hypothetical protein
MRTEQCAQDIAHRTMRTEQCAQDIAHRIVSQRSARQKPVHSAIVHLLLVLYALKISGRSVHPAVLRNRSRNRNRRNRIVRDQKGLGCNVALLCVIKKGWVAMSP